MKIRTITCHDVCNYGASLQAFALQHYLESLGHDVRIIDYKPHYQKAYDIWKLGCTKLDRLARYSYLIHCCSAFRKYLGIIKTKGRIKAFQLFKDDYLNCTETYTDYNQLVQSPPVADLYIAGSDQIWNTDLNNGKDPAYYMCFGSQNTKRISYAASFAISDLEGYSLLVSSLLANVDIISVREKSAVTICNKIGRECVHVLDPVFLLNSEEWLTSLKIKDRKIKEKYILVYDIFQTDDRLREKALVLSTKLKCKIVAINDRMRTPYADININNGSPVDFVNLIANSDSVIADSFHATAFSTIFHKDIYVFYNKKNISRMKDFLALIGLESFLNPSKELEPVNWDNVQQRLDVYINDSKQYLAKSIHSII